MANIRPYVYVSNATFRNRDTPHGDPNFVLELDLANWGPGPGLTVHGAISGGWLRFFPSRNKLSLASGDNHGELVLGSISIESIHYGDDARSDAVLTLEYKDLFDRFWSTQVHVRGQRIDFGVIECDVREHTYKVEQVDRFSIPVDLLGPGEDTGI